MPTIQRPAGQLKTPLAVFLALPVEPASARQQADRDRADDRVDDTAAERPEPVDSSVGAFGAVSKGGPNEPPERIAGQSGGDEGEQEMTEVLVLDGS